MPTKLLMSPADAAGQAYETTGPRSSSAATRERLQSTTDSRHLHRTVDALSAELAVLGDQLIAGSASTGSVVAVAERMNTASRERVRLRSEIDGIWFATMRRGYDAQARLRDAETVPDLLCIAPRELCDACDVDRAMISRVAGSSWTPAALHTSHESPIAPAADGRDAVLALDIALWPPLIEAEVVRRVAATIVDDATRGERTHEALTRLSGTRQYMVAPISAGGQVVGLLHADNHRTRRLLRDDDLDALKAFAAGVGLAVECVVLAERLRAQRRQISEIFDATSATMADIERSPIALARRRELPESEDRGLARIAMLEAEVASGGPVDDILTPREQEVLVRMSQGASNTQIADDLLIGVSTVKSHVKHIFKKLRATNRAEAVSRYFRLAEGPEAER